MSNSLLKTNEWISDWLHKIFSISMSTICISDLGSLTRTVNTNLSYVNCPLTVHTIVHRESWLSKGKIWHFTGIMFSKYVLFVNSSLHLHVVYSCSHVWTEPFRFLSLAFLSHGDTHMFRSRLKWVNFLVWMVICNSVITIITEFKNMNNNTRE